MEQTFFGRLFGTFWHCVHGMHVSIMCVTSHSTFFCLSILLLFSTHHGFGRLTLNSGQGQGWDFSHSCLLHGRQLLSLLMCLYLSSHLAPHPCGADRTDSGTRQAAGYKHFLFILLSCVHLAWPQLLFSSDVSGMGRYAQGQWANNEQTDGLGIFSLLIWNAYCWKEKEEGWNSLSFQTGTEEQEQFSHTTLCHSGASHIHIPRPLHAAASPSHCPHTISSSSNTQVLVCAVLGQLWHMCICYL